MTSPRSSYINAAGYELHVTEWGDRTNPALVMWHGLARNGRDFDEAANRLAERYFVLCPDTIGRGLSSWARDRQNDYAFPVYCATALGMLDHYGIEKLRWLGTSMGGLLGVTLAGGTLRKRITHLVINDIGPDIPPEAAARIASYVGKPPSFDTMTELEAWYRKSYAPFGDNSDSFWRRLTETSARRADNGKLTVHYDPAIVSQFTDHADDLNAWPAFDAVTAKTLVLRGADSDVLPRAVADEMQRRGPRPRVEEFSGFGHAPTLASERELEVVRRFLAE